MENGVRQLYGIVHIFPGKNQKKREELLLRSM